MQNLKVRLVKITLIFSVLLIGVMLLMSVLSHSGDNADTGEAKAVDCNEISQLIDLKEYDLAREKLDDLRVKIKNSSDSDVFGTNLIVLGGIIICVMTMVFLYVYMSILRPFDKMKKFASEIAKGNFDVPLNYERSNYFGAFTWAFDSMRKEIIRARAAEHEAMENNKTVIATLSHDIKTPIASIRAYAEGLEANLDKSPERRTKYLEVLMRKCDEVTELTNDLFLHSLSDMGKIEIKPEELDLVPYVEQAVKDIAAERGDVVFRKPDLSPCVLADRKRITQVIENIINNSRKYAKTDINISVKETDGYAEIIFRDRGAGIPDEDMPFITDKFYRGKNTGKENGSGLGLYIVKYIAEQSGGTLALRNMNPGLEVTFSLPIKKNKEKI